MDPSQRKLLEVVYEAFENAGVSWDGFSGSQTGVYVGNFATDHALIQGRDEFVRPYTSTGTALSIMSNRVSYALNLKGPRYVSYLMLFQTRKTGLTQLQRDA
jgi:acyl transferase domain-containing protein